MQRTRQIEILKELMRQLDEQVNVDAGVMYRNPTEAYTSRELATQEWQQFFRGHPQMIGLSGHLPEANSFFTVDEFGVPVLATRDEHGVFRAFVNACRHRGVRVANDASGVAGRFMCPFHNWTYSSGGDLVGVPRARDFGEIDRSCHGLKELPACEKYGLLWVHPQPDGHLDVDELLGGLGPELAGWNFGSLRYMGETVLKSNLNWKLANDTFGETYHFPRLHKNTLGNLFHGDALVYEPFSRNHRFVWANRSIDALREQAEDEWDYEKGAGWLYYLFPNVQLGGGGHSASVIKIYPDGENPGCSITRVGHYYSQEMIEHSRQAEHVITRENVYDPGSRVDAGMSIEATMEIFDSTIEQEDYLMGETTQQAAESGLIDHVLFGRNEPALHHYHNTFRAALGMPPMERLSA